VLYQTIKAVLHIGYPDDFFNPQVYLIAFLFCTVVPIK